MKINALLLSISCVAVAAILLVAYRVAVFAATIAVMNLSGEMAYLDFGNFDWTASFIRFSCELVKLSGIAGLMGWLVSAFYNLLSETFDSEPRLK